MHMPWTRNFLTQFDGNADLCPLGRKSGFYEIVIDSNTSCIVGIVQNYFPAKKYLDIWIMIYYERNEEAIDFTRSGSKNEKRGS